jgi:TPP-dependent pyruvate/acetoin dehydrogenase alpha subunit
LVESDLSFNLNAVESNEKKRKVKKYNFEKIFKFGLNAEYMRVNGNDFEKVYKSTKILRRNILTKNKIGILHLDCIRHAKHSGANVSADDQKSKYRKRGEFNQIKKFDPIKILSKKLIRIGFDLRKIEHLEKEIKIKAENIFYETIKNIKLRSI